MRPKFSEVSGLDADNLLTRIGGLALMLLALPLSSYAQTAQDCDQCADNPSGCATAGGQELVCYCYDAYPELFNGPPSGCEEPTPTPTPTSTPTPTASPSSSPTPTPSPFPTQNPTPTPEPDCNENCSWIGRPNGPPNSTLDITDGSAPLPPLRAPNCQPTDCVTVFGGAFDVWVPCGVEVTCHSDLAISGFVDAQQDCPDQPPGPIVRATLTDHYSSNPNWSYLATFEFQGAVCGQLSPSRDIGPWVADVILSDSSGSKCTVTPCGVDKPTPTPTPSPTPTNSPTPTPTPTPTQTSTETPTPTPTASPTPPPQGTETATPTPTATSPQDPDPTATPTPDPTSTPTPQPTTGGGTPPPTQTPQPIPFPTPDPPPSPTPLPDPNPGGDPISPGDEVDPSPGPSPTPDEGEPGPESPPPQGGETPGPGAQEVFFDVGTTVTRPNYTTPGRLPDWGNIAVIYRDILDRHLPEEPPVDPNPSTALIDTSFKIGDNTVPVRIDIMDYSAFGTHANYLDSVRRFVRSLFLLWVLLQATFFVISSLEEA